MFGNALSEFLILKKNIINIILFLAVILVSYQIYAEGAVKQTGILPEEMVLDGDQYSKSKLNIHFLDAVFSADTLNVRPNFKSLYLDIRPKSFTSPANLSKNFPWLYPHIYPEKGTPKLLAINKWVKPIKVSFGMPNDLKHFDPEDGKSADTVYSLGFEKAGEKERVLIQEMEPFVESFISQLSAVSKQDIKYIPHEKETVKNYADIRINVIPISKHAENEKFKIGRGMDPGLTSYGPTPISIRDLGSGEGIIKTGFIFTALSDYQVDGYFLSNHKNEIQMTVCYIWSGNGAALIRGLIGECLLRAMGLPGMVDAHNWNRIKKTYLNPWNDKSFFTEVPFENNYALGAFDQYILKVLYDPSLLPGMDYVTAQKILLGNEY